MAMITDLRFAPLLEKALKAERDRQLKLKREPPEKEDSVYDDDFDTKTLPMPPAPDLSKDYYEQQLRKIAQTVQQNMNPRQSLMDQATLSSLWEAQQQAALGGPFSMPSTLGSQPAPNTVGPWAGSIDALAPEVRQRFADLEALIAEQQKQIDQMTALFTSLSTTLATLMKPGTKKGEAA